MSRVIHNVVLPKDNPDLRKDFLDRTKDIGDLLEHLRIEKMKVYGMNWMKRGWDSLFQNLDRKFGIMEEILWGHLIKQRVNLTDEQFIALADGLIDLANYAMFGRWFLEYMYPDQYKRLSDKIKTAMEISPMEE